MVSHPYPKGVVYAHFSLFPRYLTDYFCTPLPKVQTPGLCNSWNLCIQTDLQISALWVNCLTSNKIRSCMLFPLTILIHLIHDIFYYLSNTGQCSSTVGVTCKALILFQFHSTILMVPGNLETPKIS